MLHSFVPLVRHDSQLIVLGTMPGVVSLQKQEYYGHPRNAFWRIVYGLFGEQPPVDYRERCHFLLAHGMALWDVLAGCDIKGADDSSIRNPQPNDLSRILECADIKAIFTTGTKAFQLYKKFCYPKTGIMAIGLPSTSPANCRTSYEQLFEAYSEIKKYI